MRYFYNKYIIASLAVLLILSNFSFATAIAVCKMGEMKQSCCCKNESPDNSKEQGISKVKITCCDEKVFDLSNTNVLSINKAQDCKCFLISMHFTLNGDAIITRSINNNLHYSIPDKIPKDGIPIVISSLLI